MMLLSSSSICQMMEQLQLLKDADMKAWLGKFIQKFATVFVNLRDNVGVGLLRLETGWSWMV